MPLFETSITTLGLSDGTSVERRWNLNSPSTPLTAVAAWNDIGGGSSNAGEIVTEKSALAISTVYTCVTILAEAVASLPCRLLRSSPEGDSPAVDHSLWTLLAESPNPEMTAFTFWQTIVGCSALAGNGYAQLLRDASGAVESIWPLHPLKTEPIRHNGQLAYKTSDGMAEGTYRVISSSDILHFPLFSLDGIKGLSPVAAARESFALAKAMEKYGARWFANGAQPSSLLINKSPGTRPDPKAQKEFVEAWQAAHSGMNQHKQGILWGDWDMKTLGMSPEDSQFLVARNYQRSDIGAMFKIPAHMLGSLEKLSNNNYTGQQMGFVTDTLRPILMRIEAEIKRKLLKSSRFFVQFDTTERQRGDFQAMAQSIALARQWGVLTGNECRAMLGYAPHGTEGDVLITQVNMLNLKDLEQPRQLPPLMQDNKDE
jgi:HK97 family phage portal protein